MDLSAVFGREGDITWWQMSLRTVVVFGSSLVLVRAGHERAFGRSSAADIIVAVILGSMLSRAITGNAPLLPTLAAAAILVVLHAVVAAVAFRSPRTAALVKGKEIALVRDGEPLRDALARTRVSDDDLAEALRLRGLPPDLARVRAAYLERNGEISVVAGGDGDRSP